MNEKLLLVDDEVSILNSLGGALRDEGYRVSCARSGEEALEELQQDLPDALLLELTCVRDGAQVNDWFHAVLRYDTRHGGLRVILHASTLVAETGPRWAVHGTRGSFTKFALDTQEDALKAGLRPQLEALHDWGQDPQPGQLLCMKSMAGVAAPVTVRSAASQPPGNYLAYYAQLRDHLWGLQPQPGVTPAQVHAVMQLLALGEQSAAAGGFVDVPPVTA